jgi:rare lipoprotein A
MANNVITRRAIARRHPGRQLVVAASCLVLAACGSFVRDSAPDHYVDASRVTNAVPKVEPLSKYGNPHYYDVDGRRYYVLASAKGFHQRGVASWYGTKFHGHRTSSGEPYSMYAMTAAHKTLPIPTYVEVNDLDNGKKIVVRVNDRGPFADGRIIDLSYIAAKKLGIDKAGTANVEIRAIDPRTYNKPHLARKKDSTREPPGQLYLQVGAFTDHKNATQLLTRLVNNTTENVLINRKSEGDENLYRVRIGPLNSESEAQRIRNKLGSLGIDAPQIVVE